MKTKTLEFNGVEYIVPVDFTFVDTFIFRYPTFCGAGEGIGDMIVPETIGGMRISHICHCHDESWKACDPRLVAFIKTNMMFGYNLSVYLSTGDGGFWKTAWRVVKGAAYVGVVSVIGWKIFKKLKGI